VEQPSANTPIAAGPQPEAAATGAPPHAPTRTVFDAEQRALLDAVLDRLVPPNGKVPAAGALGVALSIERTLGESPHLRRLFLDGLRAVDLAAGAQTPFTALPVDHQDALLRRVESAHPTFFAALVNHAYRGYYTHPAVLRHLELTTGYPARPPQPLGHELPPWDDTLLAKQRDRAPFWRRTS
jgi:hypothetical protein